MPVCQIGLFPASLLLLAFLLPCIGWIIGRIFEK